MSIGKSWADLIVLSDHNRLSCYCEIGFTTRMLGGRASLFHTVADNVLVQIIDHISSRMPQ
jgi:hypothetical protein